MATVNTLVVGGGGGFGVGAGSNGTGGAGGGGSAVAYPTAGGNGTNGLGGGGAGGGQNSSPFQGANGGNGGSGVVIIAFPTDGSTGVSTSSTGGTITTVSGNQIHTFTTSGTWTMVAFSAGSLPKPVKTRQAINRASTY